MSDGQKNIKSRRNAAWKLARIKLQIKHCAICGEQGHNRKTCTNPGPLRTFDQFGRTNGR